MLNYYWALYICIRGVTVPLVGELAAPLWSYICLQMQLCFQCHTKSSIQSINLFPLIAVHLGIHWGPHKRAAVNVNLLPLHCHQQILLQAQPTVEGAASGRTNYWTRCHNNHNLSPHTFYVERLLLRRLHQDWYH